MDVENEVAAIIEAYGARTVTFEVARDRLLALTDQEVEQYDLDSCLEQEQVADLACLLCTPPIRDWATLSDDAALGLSREMKARFWDEAIRDRNATALGRRYGKPPGTVAYIVSNSEANDPESILRALKADTRFYL